MDTYHYRRHRLAGEGSEIQIQEVDGLYITKIYCDLNDFTRIIEPKLSEEDRKRFAGCKFVPIDISFDDKDLTYNATFVVAKASSQDDAHF